MRNRMSWMKPLIIMGIFAILIFIAVDMVDTVKHNCKPNGEQHLVNGVDGVVVEDKLICDGGRIKWSRN